MDGSYTTYDVMRYMFSHLTAECEGCMIPQGLGFRCTRDGAGDVDSVFLSAMDGSSPCCPDPWQNRPFLMDLAGSGLSPPDGRLACCSQLLDLDSQLSHTTEPDAEAGQLRLDGLGPGVGRPMDGISNPWTVHITSSGLWISPGLNILLVSSAWTATHGLFKHCPWKDTLQRKWHNPAVLSGTGLATVSVLPPL